MEQYLMDIIAQEMKCVVGEKLILMRANFLQGTNLEDIKFSFEGDEAGKEIFLSYLSLFEKRDWKSLFKYDLKEIENYTRVENHIERFSEAEIIKWERVFQQFPVLFEKAVAQLFIHDARLSGIKPKNEMSLVETINSFNMLKDLAFKRILGQLGVELIFNDYWPDQQKLVFEISPWPGQEYMSFWESLFESVCQEMGFFSNLEWLAKQWE